MKTAEEWYVWLEELKLESEVIEAIKQIQLDAMKEGMRIAAKITMDYDSRNDTWGGGLLTGKKNQILTAAEQLTEKDL